MTHRATIAALKSLGATVTRVRLGNGSGHLVVRHRGATVDVWPTSGSWRPRMVGANYVPVRRTGLGTLIAVLTAETLPAWMTRRAA